MRIDLSTENWLIPALSAIFGSVAGACSTYKLNKRIEQNKTKKENITNFAMLYFFIFNLRDNLLSFKEKTLLPVKKEAYEFELILDNIEEYPEKLVKNLQAQILSQFPMVENLQDYSFLFVINNPIYFLLVQVNKYIAFVNEGIRDFNKRSEIMREQNVSTNGITQGYIELIISRVKSLDEFSDNLLYLVDLLFKALKNAPKIFISKKLEEIDFNSSILLHPCIEYPHILKGWDASLDSWK